MNSQRRMISFRSAALLAAAILLIQLSVTTRMADDPSLQGMLSDFISPVVSGLAAIGLLVAAYSLEKGTRLLKALFVLVGLQDATIAQSSSTSLSAQSWHSQLTWPLYLPYFAAGSAYAMLVWSRDSLLSQFPCILEGVGGIAGLVIIRRIVSLNENSRLYALSQMQIAAQEVRGCLT